LARLLSRAREYYTTDGHDPMNMLDCIANLAGPGEWPLSLVTVMTL
jgi:hypothetical protein